MASLMHYEIHACNTFFITDEHLLTAADCLENFFNQTQINVFREHYVRIRRSNTDKSDHSLRMVEILDNHNFKDMKKNYNIGLILVKN